MEPLAHHFLTMAYDNAWANHRLLSAVEQLSQEDFVATRTSFFPSLHATLNHVVTVDWLYVEALELALAGEAPNPNAYACFDPEEPFATAKELHAAQKDVDRRLLALCRTLDAKALATPVGIHRPSGLQHEEASRMLTHLLVHQIHHRGQAHAMLAGTHVAPPQLDEFFCANDASLRKDDFAALGFSEEEIWGTGHAS